MTQIPQTPEDGRDLDVQPSTRTAWRRLLRAASPRPTKGTLLAGVLAVALGFAIAVQVRQTSNAGLEGLREGDLVRLLDTVNQDNSRLSDEIVRLEATNSPRARTSSRRGPLPNSDSTRWASWPARHRPVGRASS